MAETAAKRLKTSPVLVGTHSGHFHADEALAVYMLKLLPTYHNSQLVRTRDPKVLVRIILHIIFEDCHAKCKKETCHTVVDVGGVYDATANRYDHHQREFTTTFPDRPTKLSSAGLVYMHFGKAIVAQHLGVPEDAEQVQVIHKKIYERYVHTPFHTGARRRRLEEILLGICPKTRVML